MQIPVEQFVCDTTNNPPTTGNPVTFHQALSALVVPAVGSQSSFLVADGSIFAAGQWIQFISPSGIFRIISITGNTITIQNSAADGITPITGNPVPPTQYPTNAAFVTVGDPRQLTQAQFAALVQTAFAGLQSVCLGEIPDQGQTEQIYLLGYLKSNLCGDGDGACLRKQDLAYIDQDGILHFSNGIIADSFSVPVPEGGVAFDNSVIVNPNNGTGGGFLLPFYNPSTGQSTYVSLFSGKENGGLYGIQLSPTGQISLIDGISKQEHFWPQKEVHFGSGTYTGYSSAEVVVADIYGEPLPAWASNTMVRVTANFASTQSAGAIGIKLNDEFVVVADCTGDGRGMYESTITVPMTNGRFRLEIIPYSNDAGTTVAPSITLQSGGVGNQGFVRVALVGLSS